MLFEYKGDSVQYFQFFFNILKSYGYDLYYFFIYSLKQRAGITSFDNYLSQKIYPDYLKYGAASENVKFLALKYCHGQGIDIGAGRWPLNGARGIENSENENAYKILEADLSLDFIFSSHLLEHLTNPIEAIEYWNSKLKPSGILFMYLPHPACKMWQTENLKYHIWNPDPIFLEKYFENHPNFTIELISYLPDAYYSFVCIVKKK